MLSYAYLQNRIKLQDLKSDLLISQVILQLLLRFEREIFKVVVKKRKGNFIRPSTLILYTTPFSVFTQ
jgi:hypothetical protein